MRMHTASISFLHPFVLATALLGCGHSGQQANAQTPSNPTPIARTPNPRTPNAQESRASPAGDATLDYARQVEGRDYVFIPRKGLQDGPILFKEYEKTLSAPVAYGSLRQVSVTYAVNAAARLAAEADVRSKGFAPTRVAPRAKEGVFCVPSAGVIELIGERATQFPPKVVRTASASQLCTVVFTFDPADEAKVVGYLKGNDAVEEAGTLASCSPRSGTYGVSKVIQRLEASGTLVGTPATGTGADSPSETLSGDYVAFVYDVSVLAAQEPALFETSDAKAAALDFLAATPAENEKVTLARSAVSAPRFLCDRADISIRLR